MKKPFISLTAAMLIASVSSVNAQPEYVTIEMEIDVGNSASQVWSKVGGYCAISDWLGVDCEIT